MFVPNSVSVSVPADLKKSICRNAVNFFFPQAPALQDFFEEIPGSAVLRISEDLLRRANGKFEQRFRIMETEAENAGLQLADLSTEQLDALWEKAKTTEK